MNRRRQINTAMACTVVAVALASFAGANPGPIRLRALFTGEPGSPTATMTIDGNYLPAQPQRFGGQIALYESRVLCVRAGVMVNVVSVWAAV